jgi:hypothetical protein
LAAAGEAVFKDAPAGLDIAPGFADESPPLALPAGVAAGDAGRVPAFVAAGFTVAGLEIGLEEAGFDTGELVAAAPLDGAELVAGGAAALFATGGFVDVEESGVEEFGEVFEEVVESPESVVVAVGFFDPELSQLKSWPFQRMYPKPPASASATRIKTHFPAPPLRGSSSSSSR